MLFCFSIAGMNMIFQENYMQFEKTGSYKKLDDFS